MNELHAMVERGRQARELLQSPAFNSVCNDLFALWQGQIFATKPQDDEARRVIHGQHLALQMVIGLLHNRVSQGDAALEAIENEENNE